MQKINLFTILASKTGLNIFFGGPAAHLNIFRRVFVQEKRGSLHMTINISSRLLNFYPVQVVGQVGIAIGYLKHGYLGSVCAWVGFTLPLCIDYAEFGLFSISNFSSFYKNPNRFQ